MRPRKNGLPATALLFDGMRRLCVERHPHQHAIRTRQEFNGHHALAEKMLGQLVLDDIRVGPRGEIKTNAAVLGLLAGGKRRLPRRSTKATAVCQSSDAAFKCMTSAGVV